MPRKKKQKHPVIEAFWKVIEKLGDFLAGKAK